MKKSFQIIGALTLIWFSFFCTEKTTNVIKNSDEIMILINQEKELYNVKFINAIINEDEIIPGKKGFNVNVEQSYEKMKRLGTYNSSLYVYTEVNPNISLYNNYDKFIINGNSQNRNISFIIELDNLEYIQKLNYLLKQNEIVASFFLSDEKSLEYLKMINFDKLDYDIVLNDVTFNKYNNYSKKVYCYNKEKNKTFVNQCASNKLFSILPAFTIYNNFYTTIKNNLKPGLIVLVKVNQSTLYEFQTVINYIKLKGYNITNLTTLIAE